MFNLKVNTLILLSFVLGTCEYVVIGILPNIAEDLNVAITQAGLLISVFAFTYSICAIFLTAYLSRYPRKNVLVTLMILFTIGNVICALTPNYTIMFLSRIFLAAVSSVLIATSMSFAPDVAPRRYTASVISWIFAGFNIASVVGVPLSMFITQLTSWRASFIFISVISAILLILMAKFLPNKSLPKAKGIGSQLILLKDSKILKAVAAMILSASSAYCFYTYLTPIFTDKMLLPQSTIGIAFIVFGIAAIISNLASPLLLNLGGIRIVWITFLLQAILSALLSFTMDYTILGGITVFALGVLLYIFNTPIQLHFIKVSKKYYPGTVALASALTPSAYNIGIAIGSFAGSITVDQFGLSYVGIAGAIFALLATLISYDLAKQIKHIYHEAIQRAIEIKNIENK